MFSGNASLVPQFCIFQSRIFHPCLFDDPAFSFPHFQSTHAHSIHKLRKVYSQSKHDKLRQKRTWLRLIVTNER